jgi:hypothetical protein
VPPCPAHPTLLGLGFVLVLKMGSGYIIQFGLVLLSLRDPLAFASKKLVL